ncbi:uncharacterized protein LOC123545199 [Mercenaria mercenaria]|uniref:uncharacterized protein LOC123545199 n=1 Tax=Mercenaria mercenaria TaxID=6596 RepID=UPI00234ECE39|nr:uncharacterized protein LOC123545199 [Mercenaria mercenaria]
MANAKATLSDTINEGSDDWHEFTCGACDKEGKFIKADKYCVECDENLCKDCVKLHNRFGAMKMHQLHDKYFKDGRKGQALPNQRCGRHSGKLLDVFCKLHDAVCCATCVTLEHSNCKGMVYLPEAAKDVRSSAEMKKFEVDLKDIQTNLSSIKQEIQNHLQTLKDEKKGLLKQIRDFREKINKHLDKMESHLKDNIKTKFLSEKNVLKRSMEKVDNTTESLRRHDQLLENVDKKNESEMFVQLKIGKNIASVGVDLLKEMEQRTLKRNLCTLHFDYNVRKILDETTSLAVLSQECNVSSAKFASEFSVRIPEDANIPMIRSLCEIENDGMIITDTANCRMKKLDESFCVTSFLDLNAEPYSSCYIGVNTVAVTMENSKVQFVFVGKPMVRTLSFVVGKGCRGISYFNKELFMCCGGNHMPGSVEVYDLHGTHLRSYFDQFAMPTELASSTSRGLFYITDNKRGLIIMDRNFVLQTIIKNKDLENQQGICFIEDTKLCIGGCQTNNIALFNMDGKFVKYLLSAKDGVLNPISLCYLSNQHALVVTMHKCDRIKLFSLKNV